jgi:transposase InsO family protein
MYKKYDQRIKDIIIKTQNINAFPELNIPRTTALYWIRNSELEIKKVSSNDIYEKEFNNLNELYTIEKAKILFTKSICQIYSKKMPKELEENEIRRIINYHKNGLSISTLCKLSHFDIKKYYKYNKANLSLIHKQDKPNQLTIDEQKSLIKLSHDKELIHLSIKQLQLYAARNNTLHCHYDTWRKYIRKFNITRLLTNQIRTKKPFKKLNYTSPNHAWHIDVTYFKGHDGNPLYVQVLLDSYSRAVISWKLSTRRNKELTITHLKSCLFNEVPRILICDGGGENINLALQKLLIQKNILRLVATGKNKYINARIEAFFNTLKNRYINKHKIYSPENLTLVMDKAIRLYNNSPCTLFYGLTPLEILKKKYNTEEHKEQLNSKLAYARIKRINTYNKEVPHS